MCGLVNILFIFSAYATNVLKKPVQDQNSPLTVPAVETEQPPPKPKKFFKSRNAEAFPPVPQITYAPPVPAAPLSPEHPSSSKEKKTNKRSRAYNRDSSSPELPRRSFEKSKSKKNSLATKASKKEDASVDGQPPNKRYLSRNRDKVINYAEDGSNSPIPDFTRYERLSISRTLSPPKIPSPKASPVMSSPTPLKAGVVSPSTSKDSNEERKPPPIVLRISKGTSRIVSTDSNEGLTSPSSDRHSSLDTHSDFGSDHKKSPSMETICSPKHEGLKITIKCSGLNQESKKEKKKEKKEHKSHKRHHKNVEEESKKAQAVSPQPGSDAYDLYKTLASPSQDSVKETANKQPVDDIESQLEKLDSIGSNSKSPRLEVQPKEPPPEPKPPERASGGRSRRNRPNINYSENDDYLDVLTTGYSSSKQGTKTVADLKKESRKGKKKLDTIVEAAPLVTAEPPEVPQERESESELQVEKEDVVDTVPGDSEPVNKPVDSLKLKIHKKHKHKHKNSSPDEEYSVEMPQENNVHQEEEIDHNDHENPQEEEQIEEHMPAADTNEDQGPSQANTHSTDSAYNSCPNDNLEEDSHKTQDEMFKSPQGVCDEEQNEVDKPSVKLVITKKKGSIFKSKSLMNDNPSPLPARKRRHLYRHEWANDVSNFLFFPSFHHLNTHLYH